MGEPQSSRAWTVVSGTLVVSFASSCLTGLYATFSSTSRSFARLATASAFNSAVTSATFFSIREYLVTPVHQQLAPPAPEEASWKSIRQTNILDSGVSGLATGGLIRGVTAGRRTIIPAALMTGVACVALQAAYNELRVQRIKYIGKRAAGPPIDDDKPPLADRILGALGVRPLSNEDVIEKLKRERERYLQKIERLEAQLADEQERKQK